MFPELKVNIPNICANAAYLKKECREAGVEITVVTKVVCGNPILVHALKKAGIESFGDSRLKNLQRLQQNDIDTPLYLVRIPMPSELAQVPDTVDVLLISEIGSVETLLQVTGKKETKLIFMVDMGDLREGVWFEQIDHSLSKVQKLAKNRLVGVGTNLGCFGGILPEEENLSLLKHIAHRYSLSIISGGNTAALKLIEDGTLPKGINHFRLGESVFLGNDVTRNRKIPALSQDTFVLEAEIVELQEKPSVPRGSRGQDAFGRVPEFINRGWRKKAILAIGEQDVMPSGLLPLDEAIEVLHASSDHTILDITESKSDYRVGDIVQFHLSYGALLRSMTSEYVFKKIVV